MAKTNWPHRPKHYTAEWVEKTGVPFIRQTTKKLRKAAESDPIDRNFIIRHFTKTALCAHLGMSTQTFYILEDEQPAFSKAIKDYEPAAAYAYDVLSHMPDSNLAPAKYIFVRSNISRLKNWKRQDSITIEEKDKSKAKKWAATLNTKEEED